MQTKNNNQNSASHHVFNPFPFENVNEIQHFLMEYPMALHFDNLFENPSIYHPSLMSWDSGVDFLAQSATTNAIAAIRAVELNHVHLKALHSYLENKTLLIPNKKNAPESKWLAILIGTSMTEDLKKAIKAGLKYNETPIVALTIMRYKDETGEIHILFQHWFKKCNSKELLRYVL